jgi:ribosomal protein L11 methyltransferase
VPSSWLQLSLRTDPAAFDALSNFLIERGSPGVLIKKHEIQAYFVHSAHDASIRKDVQRFLRGIHGIYSEIHEARMQWRILRDRNWNSSWRRFFTPQKIGKLFWVTPPWTQPPQSQRRHIITIEPGMAFGTGTHATTRGCLEFIEEVACGFKAPGFSALDVGTGSGILAIALAKVGAEKVWALDNDPTALKVARENLSCNGVRDKVHLSARHLNRVRKVFPVVVANLTAETIIEMAGALGRRVGPDGFLVLSGILNPKANEVLTRFPPGRFKMIKRRREKEWTTLLLHKR